MEHQATEIEHWDSWNLAYRQPGIVSVDRATNRRMEEVLASLSRLRIPGARILEVGCGTGWLSQRLADFGSVTAVDLGAEIIRKAQASMPHIDFRSGDVLDLELPVNGFDVAVTVETLAHVADQVKFVHRIAQLLKPGGHLVLTTQNKFVFDRCLSPKPAQGSCGPRTNIICGGGKAIAEDLQRRASRPACRPEERRDRRT